MPSDEPSIYDEMVRITHVYLGPAADRFIARQVQNHLKKQPEAMTKKDLVGLLDWIQISVSLLTDDSEIIEEYISNLKRLTGPEKKPKKKAKKAK